MAAGLVISNLPKQSLNLARTALRLLTLAFHGRVSYALMSLIQTGSRIQATKAPSEQFVIKKVAEAGSHSVLVEG
jgi:hypothetical protein